MELVKKLFTKLSPTGISTSQLIAKDPAIFTGSEVYLSCLNTSSHIYLIRIDC